MYKQSMHIGMYEYTQYVMCIAPLAARDGDNLVVTWTEVDGVTYKCSLDGGTATPCE